MFSENKTIMRDNKKYRVGVQLQKKLTKYKSS